MNRHLYTIDAFLERGIVKESGYVEFERVKPTCSHVYADDSINYSNFEAKSIKNWLQKMKIDGNTVIFFAIDSDSVLKYVVGTDTTRFDLEKIACEVRTGNLFLIPYFHLNGRDEVMVSYNEGGKLYGGRFTRKKLESMRGWKHIEIKEVNELSDL
jgi:hypothetical protein